VFQFAVENVNSHLHYLFC